MRYLKSYRDSITPKWIKEQLLDATGPTLPLRCVPSRVDLLLHRSAFLLLPSCSTLSSGMPDLVMGTFPMDAASSQTDP